MIAGTSTVRTINASTRIAAAIPRPMILIVRSVLSVKAANTTTMIAASAVIVRPVMACPWSTARALSRVFSHSSWMRLTRNTS